MPSVPEYVYIIMETSRWPIAAIPDSPFVADQLSTEFEKRLVGPGTEYAKAHLKLYRCRITDVEEVELVPARMTKPYIRPKGAGGTEPPPGE